MTFSEEIFSVISCKSKLLNANPRHGVKKWLIWLIGFLLIVLESVSVVAARELLPW